MMIFFGVICIFVLAVMTINSFMQCKNVEMTCRNIQPWPNMISLSWGPFRVDSYEMLNRMTYLLLQGRTALTWMASCLDLWDWQVWSPIYFCCVLIWPMLQRWSALTSGRTFMTKHSGCMVMSQKSHIYCRWIIPFSTGIRDNRVSLWLTVPEWSHSLSGPVLGYADMVIYLGNGIFCCVNV